MRESIGIGCMMVTMAALVTSACAGGAKSESLASTEIWKEVSASVGLSLQKAQRFHASHQLKGLTVTASVKQLAVEQFRCELRFATFPRPIDSKRMQYEVVNMPFLRCLSSGREDYCKVQQVVLEVAWLNEKAMVENLPSQYDQSKVEDFTYQCLDDWPKEAK